MIVEMSPWGARDTLVLLTGEKIVLHDLEDGQRLTEAVRYKLESRALPAAA